MADKSIYEVKELIGEGALQTIVDNYPGVRFYVPKKKIYFPDQASKEEYIKNLFFSSAWKIEKIADEVGLSVDRIKQIVYQR